MYYSLLLAIFLVLSSVTPVFGVSNNSYHSVGDVFGGALKSLTYPAPWGNPYLGGQDFIHCCLLAVNDSLQVTNRSLEYKPGQTTLRGTFDDLTNHNIPCHASYRGSATPPPNVWVSYSWCNSNCPGFALSWTDSYSLNLWLRPLVAFLAPALIFCLNVPRRRRLEPPASLFPSDLRSFPENLTLVYKVPLAALIVSFDVIIWMMVVVSMAGPLLLSGTYEAILDARLLRFLNARMKTNSLTVRERAHLMAIMLIGNLDLQETWEQSRLMIAELPHDSLRRRFSSDDSSNAALSPRTSVSPTLNGSANGAGSIRSNTNVFGPYDRVFKCSIDSFKIRLKTALQTQIDFGSAVGAAVVFYSGAFVYSIIEIRNNYGDGSFSHELAFGMLWMVIPHVAIISSLLLASNNPSIWEGIVHQSDGRASILLGSPRAPRSRAQSVQSKQRTLIRFSKLLSNRVSKLYTGLTSPAYDSKYKPAWMWNRGSSKASWIAKTREEYPKLAMGLDQEVLRFDFVGWVFTLAAPAILLLVIPPFLGGTVSYTTPMVGLSCRSLTLLLYACSETVMIILWLLDYAFWQRGKDGKVNAPPVKATRLSLASLGWYSCYLPVLFMGFVTGIMGTVFQLISLYSNCLCFLPLQYWSTRFSNPKATFFLSSVDSETVWFAKHYWLTTGITATAFLVTMTYIGWWYQRRMREKFKNCISRIDLADQADLQENEDRSLIKQVKI